MDMMHALTACAMTGVIGGQLGYHLLEQVGRGARGDGRCSGKAYENKSKLEVLFGGGIWSWVAGKHVIDFGCGGGLEAIELARHGAARVTGIDIREVALAAARRAAAAAGVADRCVFTTATDEKADVIVSIDGFEHYGNPEAILRLMRRLIDLDGRVLVAFGPTWYHPLGGHLFSVFPWSHLVFTERALIRWRADFKFDGATRFSETEGGLNQMTIRRFRRILGASDFDVASFETVPIRRLHWLSNPLTREFATSIVRCRLTPRQRGDRAHGAAPEMR